MPLLVFVVTAVIMCAQRKKRVDVVWLEVSRESERCTSMEMRK
jgi:hypothetical protein